MKMSFWLTLAILACTSRGNAFAGFASTAGGRHLLQSATSCPDGYGSTCQSGLLQDCSVFGPSCEADGFQLLGQQCCCCPIEASPSPPPASPPPPPPCEPTLNLPENDCDFCSYGNGQSARLTVQCCRQCQTCDSCGDESDCLSCGYCTENVNYTPCSQPPPPPSLPTPTCPQGCAGGQCVAENTCFCDYMTQKRCEPGQTCVPTGGSQNGIPTYTCG